MSRQSTPYTRTAAPGTGQLHQALEDARDRDTLRRFCSAYVCTPAEVSEDGKRLHMPRVLQLMRTRGYAVSEPFKAPHQPKRGLTAWMVHIRTERVEFDIGYYTPEAVQPREKKPQIRTLEHA
jgi:hypothetical protein